MFKRLKHALLGQTATQERRPDDVDALVASCQSPETTKLLLSFGDKLLKANDDRVAAIDAKATALVGYGTAILAFLVTRDLVCSWFVDQDAFDCRDRRLCDGGVRQRWLGSAREPKLAKHE